MARLLEVNPYSPEYPVIREVCDALRKGELAVIPTDSVYTIVGALYHKKSIPALQKIKGGKADFSVMTASLAELNKFAKQIERPVFRVMNKALPGPYTFILESAQETRKIFGDKKREIGLRVPGHLVTQAVLEMLGEPLVCTSVNDEDHIIQYTTDPVEIAENLEGLVSIILDGGFGGNEPSTIIDCTSGSPEMIRQGAGDITALL